MITYVIIFYNYDFNILQLKDRNMVLNQRLIDKQRVKQKYNTKMQVETDKMNKELEIKLRQQREQLQVK